MSEFIRLEDGTLTLNSWDGFVVRHQKPSNLLGHFVSFLMFYGGPLVALLTAKPLWLLLFFASGAVGALSHHLTGDGKINLKEATSSPLVVFYVTVMFARILRGTYREDINRANDRYRRLLAITDR
jgi:hypothetical protein